MNLRALVLLCTALTTACAVGPDYVAPSRVSGAEAASSFLNASVDTKPGAMDPAPLERFWARFGDPVLDRLVDEVLIANPSLNIARANLRASRDLARLAGFDRFPTVTSSASLQRGLLSESQAPGVDRGTRESTRGDAGFDAIWELDFFGRVRRGVEAATADADASLATLRDVQVSAVAEAARHYFVLRGLQDQLGVARRNADNQMRSLQITRARFDAGRGNQLDIARAEALLQTTLAMIPQLEAAIERSLYRIAVLSGHTPERSVAELRGTPAQIEVPALTGIGSPADLLRRRPDIRAAERRVAASTARIGIATAELFPRISLGGGIGYQANRIEDLGNSGSYTYAIGPGIYWAAFDLGRVKKRIAISRAQADASLALYEKTVLEALEETEGALISYDRALVRRRTLESAGLASRRAADLSRERYEGGLTHYLDVLDAERSALEAESALAQGRTDVAVAFIAIYKALGGDWSDADPLLASKQVPLPENVP